MSTNPWFLAAINIAAFAFVFAFSWWWGKRQSVSLGAVPPAAEGGRPGGVAAAPAAPRRDVQHRHRYVECLARICIDCGELLDEDANPLNPSPQPDPLRSEAARPEPSRDGDLGGPGRATNFP